MEQLREGKEYRITLSDKNLEVERGKVLEKLKEYNDSQSEDFRKSRLPGEGSQPLELYLWNEREEMVGGLLAFTIWGWLVIDILWIDDSLRKMGYGRELLIQAESQAKKRGCTRAKLGTYSFQAKDFYEKLGYHVVGKYEDYPPGHVQYWLKKDLVY